MGENLARSWASLPALTSEVRRGVGTVLRELLPEEWPGCSTAWWLCGGGAGAPGQRWPARVRGRASEPAGPSVAAEQAAGLRRKEAAFGRRLGASLALEGRLVPILQVGKRKSLRPAGLQSVFSPLRSVVSLG